MAKKRWKLLKYLLNSSGVHVTSENAVNKYYAREKEWAKRERGQLRARKVKCSLFSLATLAILHTLSSCPCSLSKERRVAGHHRNTESIHLAYSWAVCYLIYWPVHIRVTFEVCWRRILVSRATLSCIARNTYNFPFERILDRHL